ncbi:DUF4143 domain-containing protein [Arcanobacterium hippocoleae]
MSYRKRAIDLTVQEELASMGAVLIEGARGSGKTETGIQNSHSQFRLDRNQNKQLAELNPASALVGETPRLIDEWQLVPQIWNEVRHEIDVRRIPGQFILSGSASPSDEVSRHTGAGRISRIRMRPMALGEVYPDEGNITLTNLRTLTNLPPRMGKLSYRDLATEAVRGGWPVLISTQQSGYIRWVRNYLENIAHVDLAQAGNDFAPERVRRLLRSVARNISSEATAATLSADVSADGGMLSAATVRVYLDALTRIFVFEELSAWDGSLRSKSRLRKQAKLHFCDPSLACAALRVTDDSLANNPEYFGQVFESMAVRDIRTYSEQIDASCFSYRDNSGLEVDLLIEFAEGAWAGIEVKLGESPQTLALAERNLLRLRDSRMVTPPEFLAIVTGGTGVFTLPSGIHVIPLSVLGPNFA